MADVNRIRLQGTDPFGVVPIFSQFIKSFELKERINPVRAGQTLKFRQGKSDGLYLIHKGLLKLETLSPEPRILRLLSKGDAAGFGYWRLGRSERYQLTAIEASEVSFLPRRLVEETLMPDPEFNKLLIDHLLETIQHKDERLISLQSHSAEERVLRLIVWLAKRFGQQTAAGLLIDVAMDRDSYAQLAGVMPETFSRMVSHLGDKNLVRRQRRRLIVSDLDKLLSYLQNMND